MKFFSEIEKILAIAGLNTTGNNIRRSVIRFLIISLTALGSLMEGIVCFNAIGLTAVLWPFCIMVTFLSVTALYMGLINKTTQINELFAYMDHLIGGSKFCNFSCF